MLTFSWLLAHRLALTLTTGTFSFPILVLWRWCVDGQLVAHFERLAHRSDYPHRLALQQQTVRLSELRVVQGWRSGRRPPQFRTVWIPQFRTVYKLQFIIG